MTSHSQALSTPTAAQLNWQAKEFGLFFHFGINTFHNREWSAGQLPPESFNPQKFDAAQWVAFAQEVGAGYLILTAKHHDGFCLWPTETTEYSIRHSPRQIDIVGELSQACAEAKMPFGLYLSPWDRNAICYPDKDAYDDFYARQLTELCTRYGELFELWFDGAGSEGRVYDWERFMKIVEQHQPTAMIFNMGNPTIRWIGNEDGLAADPCEYAVNSLSVSAFTEREDAISDQKIYLPPECDVAIRQHWFWQDDDLETLKTKEHLLGIWYRSIGLGANLLLNLGPNRDGLLDENDMNRVREVVSEIRTRFAHSIEGKLQKQPYGYSVEFENTISFDHLVLREDYSQGQKVDGYTIHDEHGNEFASGHTIGHQKWHVFPTVSTRKIEVRLSPTCSADSTLLTVSAYQTGYEALPELGSHLDYGAWSLKADARDADILPWRKSS